MKVRMSNASAMRLFGVALVVHWSSQALVDTSFGPSVSRFELHRAHAIEVAVPTCRIVKRLDVVLLQAPKKDSTTAQSQQLPLRLMLGSRWLERQNRRDASLPNCVP